MGTPSRVHVWLAGALLALVVVLCGLGVVRFIEHGREVRLAVFDSVGRSMELALATQAAAETGGKNPLGRLTGEGGEIFQRAQKMLQEPGTRRVFLVERGRKLENLGVSRPAKVWLDMPQAQESGDAVTEAVLALVAKLDHRFSENKESRDVSPRELAWGTKRGEQSLMVGLWPLWAGEQFVGVVGVERAPTVAGEVLVVPAAVLLAVWLLGFGLWLWRRPGRPWLGYAVTGGVTLLLGLGLLFSHQQQVGQKLTQSRDMVVTQVANLAEWTDPAAVDSLSAKWTQVFQDAPVDLQMERTQEGGLAVWEGPAASRTLAWGLTWPVAVLLVVLLGLCAWGLSGTAGVVWGLAKMPGVYAYVAPAMAGMLVLVLVPFLMGVGLAFFNQDYEFVGMQNFKTILFPSGTSDTNFYFTLGVTVLWTVSNIFLHVGIGLFLALILVSPKVRFKGLFRVLLIVPWAVPNYITALIWRWMFTAKIGAINRLLEAVGIQGPDWFGQSFWANFGANLATNVWLGFPFMMVVSMGALQSIPNELYEAADVDGASRWQKFRHITLPLLKPALFPAIILGTIWTFNMFNVIYLVSRGGPDNQTNILITEAYRFFKELNQYGVAAAYCILIFVILMLYTLVTNRVTKATKGAFE